MPDLSPGDAVEYITKECGWSREDAEHVVSELMDVDTFWSPEAIALGARAHFRCEYCGRDLLGSSDDFKLWERDHILRSDPPDDSLENLALSCLVCNSKLKSKWTPPGETRGERIQAVVDYVADLRARNEQRLKGFHRILSR